MNAYRIIFYDNMVQRSLVAIAESIGHARSLFRKAFHSEAANISGVEVSKL